MFGEILGNGLGQAGGQWLGGDQGRGVGGTVGGALGSYLIPFQKGGRVKAPRGKPVPALVHGVSMCFLLAWNQLKLKLQKLISYTEECKEIIYMFMK